MNILYIANARMPTEKAYGWQTVKSIEAWQKLGVKVKLLVLRRENHIKKSIKDFYGLTEDIETYYVGGVFNRLEISFKKLYFYLQRIEFGILAFFYALSAPVKAIYSRSITLCFFLNLFGKLAVYEDHEPKNRLIWLYRLFVKVIKKKVLVAYNLQNIYQKFKVDLKTYIIAPNGVDLKEFARVKQDKNIWQNEFIINKGKIILYVGHFYAWKGVYTLLDTAPSINGQIVLIGGTKEDNEVIKSYITNHNLDNVHLKNFVSHYEVIKYLKSADVLVLPNTSQEERSAKYTTPIKLFEYMASGVPMVASNLQSFRAYLKDCSNCYLFIPDNSNSLAEKINFVLNNLEQSKKVAEKALQDVEQYSWDKRMEKINNFIFQK